MRPDASGRLVVTEADWRALLTERRAQLERLRAELAGKSEREREPHARRLRTAAWSVTTIEEQMRKRGWTP